MVSVEVAVEIGRFAGEFQEEGGVSAGQINAELDKICQPQETEPGENTGKDAAQKAEEATAMEEESGRITILKQFRSEEEMENLKNLVEDARRKTALAAVDVQRGGL